MPYVVEQGCMSHELLGFRIEVELPGHSACNMRHTERVFKACMSGAWIYQGCECELPDSSKSLEYRCVDKIPFLLFQRDEPVHGISDLSGRQVFAPCSAFAFCKVPPSGADFLA